MEVVKKGIVILFFMASYLCSVAQDGYHPKLITSDYRGEVMLDGLELQKKIDDVIAKSYEDAREVRLKQISFVSESLLSNQQLRNSGSVVYNKSIDAFLEKIKNHIQSVNSEYDLSLLRIKVIRNSSVNAFASDNGDIFVTIGLLARVRSEAELALILCHEFSHYLKEHNLKKVAKVAKFVYDAVPYSIISGELNKYTVHDFSKKLETEADELGMELFLKCGYTPNAYKGVFDLLGRSILPSYDTCTMKWNIPFTDVPYQENLLPEYVPFSAEEVESVDFDKATHPNIEQRRMSLSEIVEKRKVTDGKDFINVTSQEFWTIQKDAEYTLGTLYLNDLQFFSAYCQNAYLVSLYNDELSKTNWLNSLTGLCIAAGGNISLEHTSFFTQYGDTKKLKDIYRKMSKSNVECSALLSAFSLYSSDTLSEEYKYAVFTILDVLTSKYKKDGLITSAELLTKKNVSKDLVSKGDLDAKFFAARASSMSDFEAKSKFKTKELELVNTIKKKNIFSMDDETTLTSKDTMAQVLYTSWGKLDSTIIEALLVKYNQNRQPDASVNMAKDGLLIINPMALHIDEKELFPVNPIKSQEMNKRLLDNVESIFSSSDFNYSIISPFTNDTSLLFADEMYTSSLLIRQASLSGDNGLTSPFNLLVSEKEIADLCLQHNKRYIAYIGLVNYRTLERAPIEDEKLIYAKLFLALAAPLALPQWYSSNLVKHYELQYFNLIYDTKMKRFVSLDVDSYEIGLANEFDESVFLKYNLHKFKNNVVPSSR